MLNNPLFYHIKLATNGKKIWYIAEPYSLLMEVDIATKKMQCLGKIPGTDVDYSYRGIFYHEDRLYLMPYAGSTLCEYDFIKNNYTIIQFDNKYQYRLTGAIYRDGNIYMYGTMGLIIKYCLKDKKVTILFIQNSQGTDNNVIPLWWEGTIFDDKIILPSLDSNIIVEINSNDEIIIDRIGDKYEKCTEVHMNLLKNALVAVYQSELGYINIVKYCEKEIVKHKEFAIGKIKPYIWATNWKDKWFFVPENGTQLFYIDSTKDELLYLRNKNRDKLHIKNNLQFSCGINYKEVYYTIEMSRGSLYEVNKESLNYSIYNIEADDAIDYTKKCQNERMEIKKMSYEYNFFHLNDFINYVCVKN
ncbi:hypothetical protein BXO88_09075 [Oribacterium sp. C9]|uniref:hypothetical protein n=1 Tax=Oribacterium sp. C9 TaxID=1943579 RepID=UPI00098ED8CB|nr:hypothetical protein [Oribacterium sp. C9]OON86187.1 hypothetical protein BXO88_09075 [Oribacterium sp. C9]